MSTVPDREVKSLADFVKWLTARITELEDLPASGDTADSEYDPEGGKWLAAAKEYPVDPSDLGETAGRIVQRAADIAADLGCHDLYAKIPPDRSKRQDAIFQLKRLLAWCGTRTGSNEMRAEKVPHDGPYTVAEAAFITRVSERKIYQDCKEGKIRHSKNPIRITQEALHEYGREREREPVKTSGFRHLT